MTTNLGQAIGVGVGLLVTTKIAGAIIDEAKKINGKSNKDISTKQSQIKSLP